jgi:hypothetical protein
MDKTMARLIDVVKGTLVRIASIDPGDLARVVRFAPFDGPVLLEVRGMEIALGRSIAKHILVEEAACDSC